MPSHVARCLSFDTPMYQVDYADQLTDATARLYLSAGQSNSGHLPTSRGRVETVFDPREQAGAISKVALMLYEREAAKLEAEKLEAEKLEASKQEEHK